MGKYEKNPTAAELEILHILWIRHPRTVKDVHDLISSQKDVGYTTTLKIMQNMTAKGMLSREADGRGHVYSPLLNKEDTQNKLTNSFLKATFGGSAGNLVMQVLGNHKTTLDELNRIKQLINEIEKNKK